MTADLDQLEQWDSQYVWHPFTQMAEYEPWIIERAEGCYLIDAAGRRYIDAVASLWCNVHGHGHPRILAAIRDQLERAAHVTLLGMSHPPAIRLAKMLVDRAPQGLAHVFFSGDGSSAIEVALKMAFQYWRQRHPAAPSKTRYIAFEQAYHGDTLGSVSVGGVPRFHALFRPLLFDVIRLPIPDADRLPEGVAPESAASHYLAQLEEVLHRHHRSVAAVVIEPLMQCAAGMIRHPEGFLRGIRRLTYDYDVLLIADEVAVGMGRTGRLFACECESVSPDFLCLGKGITGGYLALSATLTTDQVWQAFLGEHCESRTFYHGHTYAGNPLAAAAAIATLELFDAERTLERMVKNVERLSEHLARMAQHPHVGSVRQLGLMAGIELVADKASGAPFDGSLQQGQRVCQRAREAGVALRPLGDVLVIMPPLAITIEQLDQICHAIEYGLEVLGE